MIKCRNAIVKPWPQTLSPKPLFSKAKPKGLGLTLKSHGKPPHHPNTPPHHPTPPKTFKHEGGVPQQNPESKTYSECSPLHVHNKKLRWTAKERRWSSPPCSLRTSSILLVALLSKSRSSARLLVTTLLNTGLVTGERRGKVIRAGNMGRLWPQHCMMYDCIKWFK